MKYGNMSETSFYEKEGGTYAHYSHETGLDGTYDVFNRAGTIDDRHRSEVHYKTSKEV